MAVEAILNSLDAYTGELDSLNAFVEVASQELGPDWTDKIYGALGELTDIQKEKLDHAFNYYAATTAWNEIQGYLTHDGPLNYQETLERLPVLEHWLAFFGAAGEEVVSSLKSRLKLEGAAASRDTSSLDEPFITVPVVSGAVQESVANEQMGRGDSISADVAPAQGETGPQNEVDQHMTQGAVQEKPQNGVFLNAELENARMQERINDIFSDDPSFEETHKVVATNRGITPEEQTIEPDPIIDERPEAITPAGVRDSAGGVENSSLKPAQDEEMNDIFQESDLSDFFGAVDSASLAQENVQAPSAVAQAQVPQEQYQPNPDQENDLATSQNDAGQGGSLDEFFAASGDQGVVHDTPAQMINQYSEPVQETADLGVPVRPQVHEEISGEAVDGPENLSADVPAESGTPVQRPQIQTPQSPVQEEVSEVPVVAQTVATPIQVQDEVRLTPESEQEFQVSRLFRQIDFKTAVQAWISLRCIELGYTNNYTYRYYGFLVDVMDRTIEEIKKVLGDETLMDIVEHKRNGGIHFLQNQLIALEKESKDAHDRITSDLSPLPREGLSTDDIRKALGQMDLSGEREYLGPAPDGFEMLEDPYQNLDEASVKKEYAKIEAEADLPPAEPVKPVDPSQLKKPIDSTKSASQTPQNGVQRKMSFSFGKKTAPAGSNNS